jgi:formate hydrogenlyase subunit 4
MWALLSRRFRRWLLMVVAVPLLGALARRLADRIEQRHGPNVASRALDQVGRVARSPKQRQRQAR